MHASILVVTICTLSGWRVDLNFLSQGMKVENKFSITRQGAQPVTKMVCTLWDHSSYPRVGWEIFMSKCHETPFFNLLVMETLPKYLRLYNMMQF